MTDESTKREDDPLPAPDPGRVLAALHEILRTYENMPAYNCHPDSPCWVECHDAAHDMFDDAIRVREASSALEGPWLTIR
jgi:hypothetical protein